MILRFVPGVETETLQALEREAEAEGIRTASRTRAGRTAIALLDEPGPAFRRRLDDLEAIEEQVVPRGAWRRVDRAFVGGPSTVEVGHDPDRRVVFGGDGAVVIAGPCSVEGARFMQRVAQQVAASGAHMLRGGAYKPRTSPYAFQGLGREGLRQLVAAGREVGLPVVTELVDGADTEAFVREGVDMIQIGARNAQNFALLAHAARSGLPVLLKRGMASTVEEWLCAAEYLMEHGCERVVLCERGIRSFDRATRNVLDLAVVPLLAEWTHLPVVVDPSHATGRPSLVGPMARAAIACGAAGVTVECHPDPRQARSDGPQALLPGELTRLVSDVRVFGAVARS